LDLTDGDAVASRYLMMVPAVEVDWAVRTGLVVGAVIGVGVEVRGLTPMAVLAALVTPELSEICCAYGLIWARMVTFAEFFAETAAAVLVAGLRIGVYAAVQTATSAATLAASVGPRP
jgi:hypothetical protein